MINVACQECASTEVEYLDKQNIMDSMEQDKWLRLVQKYRDTYQEMYNIQPRYGLVESYCKSNGIPWPMPVKEKLEPPGEEFWRENPLDG